LFVAHGFLLFFAILFCYFFTKKKKIETIIIT
jgi:hypothetical protein